MAKNYFLNVCLCICFLCVRELKAEDELAPLVTVINLIDQVYVESFDRSELVEESLHYLLRSLDSYSEYLSQDQYAQLKDDTEGHFAGIGVDVMRKEDALVVVAPYVGSPADKAGLRAWDEIIYIDETPVMGMNVDEAVTLIRGVVGSKVSLKVLRNSSPIDIEVQRGVVKIKALRDATLFDDTIGYVKLVQFQKDTVNELQDMFTKLLREGATSFILDLRNNPGGSLQVAVDVCGLFLRKNRKVVTLKGRHVKQSKVYRVRENPVFSKIPLLILVNAGTASSSEVVAGALQSYGRARVVGDQTFGKGLVQTLVPLSNGAAVRLTTHRYELPKGERIEGLGVTPDMRVSLETPADLFQAQGFSAKRTLHTLMNQPLGRVRAESLKDVQLIQALELSKA